MTTTPPDPSPPAGLLRRLAAGAGAQGLANVVLLAGQLLSVPVLLGAWGADAYADWLVLSAAAGLLALADLGLHGHLSNALRAAWARGDEAGGRRILQSGLGVYAALTGGLALLVGVAALAMAAQLVDGPALLGVARPDGAGTTLLLLLAATLLLLPRGLVATVHSARGAFHREVGVLTLSLAGMQGAPMLAALAGGGPAQAAAAQLAAALLLGWLPLLRGLRRRYPDLELRPLPPTRAELRRIAAKAPLYAVQQGGVLVLVNAPVLLLGWLAAPAAVVVFATLRTLVGFVRQTVQQVAVVLGLEMARLCARGDLAGAARLHAGSAAALGCATGLLAGAVWVAGPPVFALWTHGTTPFDPLVAALLLGGLLLRAPVQGAAATLRLVDRPGVVAAVQAGEVAALLLLAPALIPWAGAAGAALAAAVAEGLVSGPWVLRAAGRLFGAAVLRPALRAGAAALAGLLAALLAGALAGLATHPAGPAGLAVFAALWAVVAVPLLVAVLDAGQRAWLLGRLRRHTTTGRPAC